MPELTQFTKENFIMFSTKSISKCADILLVASSPLQGAGGYCIVYSKF
jgi:hypothetical protein